MPNTSILSTRSLPHLQYLPHVVLRVGVGRPQNGELSLEGKGVLPLDEQTRHAQSREQREELQEEGHSGRRALQVEVHDALNEFYAFQMTHCFSILDATVTQTLPYLPERLATLSPPWRLLPRLQRRAVRNLPFSV